jgi:hypothetical protein
VTDFEGFVDVMGDVGQVDRETLLGFLAEVG